MEQKDIDYLSSFGFGESEQKKEALPQWQDPISFDEYVLPKFNIEIFPNWLKEYIEGIAESTQTPIDAASMATISILSTILSKKFYVNITNEWSESLNTYTVLALPPGNRKSSVFKLLQEPITSFEREEQERMMKEVREQKAILNAKQKRVEAIEREYAKNGDSATLNEIRELTNEIEEEQILSIPRYVTGDITVEKLGVLMAENNEKMAVLSAEGGGVFSNMAGRYSTDGKANIDIYLNGHTGDYTPIDRIGREPILLNEPCLTIGLFVQSEVVRDVPATFKERGLMQRFLYSFPKSLVGHRKITPRSISEEVRTKYMFGVRKLLQFQPSESIKLTFDNEAIKLEQEIRQGIEYMLRDGEALADMREWGSKLAGQIIRIAGLLHVAEHATGFLNTIPTKINIHTLDNAKKIMSYFIEHARAAYGVMGVDKGAEDGKYLLEYLIKNGKESYTKREAFQGTKGTFKTVSRFEYAVLELEERNFIQKTITNNTGRGRKSYELLLNPMATIPTIPTNGNNLSMTRDISDLKDIPTKIPQFPQKDYSTLSGNSEEKWESGHSQLKPKQDKALSITGNSGNHFSRTKQEIEEGEFPFELTERDRQLLNEK